MYHDDSVERADCRDVAHFRMLLRQDRRADDNLKHKLNTIDTGSYGACAEVAKWLSGMHAARRTAISRCIRELTTEHLDANNAVVYHKEVLLLNGESVVEEIVEEQSWSVLKEKCRILGDIDAYRHQNGA